MGATAMLLAVLTSERPGTAGLVAYVANHGSGSVSIIDTSAHEVTGELAVGDFPAAVVFSPLGRYAYVANAGADEDPGPDTVSAIDVATSEVIRSFTVGDSPQGLALSSDGRLLYVANAGRPEVADGTVSIVDAQAARTPGEEEFVLVTVETGGDPAGIALSPDDRFLYVANRAFDIEQGVFVIDAALALVEPAQGVVAAVPAGNNPIDVGLAASGSLAFVANFGFLSNTVSVIDTATRLVRTSLHVGTRPSGVGVSPDGQLVYVTNLISDTVSIIDVARTRVRTSVTVGRAPQDVAFTADGLFAYVANRQSVDVPVPGNVSVIDAELALSRPGRAVIATLDVGLNPVAVAAAPPLFPGLIHALFSEVPEEDADVNEDGLVSVADLLAL